jgi:hypothetical protein
MQLEEPMTQSALLKSLTAGLFASNTAYKSLASDGLPRLLLLLLAAEIPLGVALQRTLARHQQVVADVIKERCELHAQAAAAAHAPGNVSRDVEPVSDALCKHARLHQLAIADEAFLNTPEAANILQWLAAVPTKRGASSEEQRRVRCIHDAWRANIEAQCNADGNVAAVGAVPKRSSLEHLLAPSTKRGSSAAQLLQLRPQRQWRDYDMPWLFVNDDERELASRRPARGGSGSVDWYAVAAMRNAAPEASSDASDGIASCHAKARRQEDSVHVSGNVHANPWAADAVAGTGVCEHASNAYKEQARALSWQQLLRCWEALERASAVVHAVPL